MDSIPTREEIQKELLAELRAAGRLRPEDDASKIKGKVYAVLTHADGSKEIHETDNIVTNDGDIHYAKKAAEEDPTDFTATSGAFTGLMGLATAVTTVDKSATYANVTTVVGSSEFVPDYGPITSGTDGGDNPGTTGADIVTYRRSYTTGQANASNISHVYLVDAAAATGSKLLSIAAFGATFTKTASDTLKVYVNHEFLGS